MRGSSLLPQRFRDLGDTNSPLYRAVTDTLVTVSKFSLSSPIPTLVVIALLASTSYVGLLQESLFDTGLDTLSPQGHLDVNGLLKGSRTLELSANTYWKWQILEDGTVPELNEVIGWPLCNLCILTFLRKRDTML